jgi:hypothetical protein
MEVCSNEGNEYRVKEVVEKFMEDFPTLVQVGLRDLVQRALRGSQPFNAADLRLISIHFPWRLTCGLP